MSFWLIRHESRVNPLYYKHEKSLKEQSFYLGSLIYLKYRSMWGWLETKSFLNKRICTRINKKPSSWQTYKFAVNPCGIVINWAQASDIYLLLFCVYLISAVQYACFADLKQTKWFNQFYCSRVLKSINFQGRVVITVISNLFLRDFPFKLKGSVLGKKSKSEGRYSVRSGGDGTSGSQRAPHGILYVNERNR